MLKTFSIAILVADLVSCFYISEFLMLTRSERDILQTEKLTLLPIMLLAVGTGAYGQSSPYAHTRITGNVDSTKLITLRGNTHPAAKAANDQGRVNDDRRFHHMKLLLKHSPEQQASIRGLLAELNNPNSDNFHKWLNARQFGEQFGPAENDLTTVKNWLQSEGFAINAVSPSGMLIDFSGTARQIRKAFHTEIHHLNVNGQAHMANMSDPQIPAALASVVTGIVSLNNFRPHSMHTKIRAMGAVTPNTTNGADQYVAPADLATIYNLNPLFQTGLSGQGQTIVVLERTNLYSAGDWFAFRKRFGLSKRYSSGTFTQVHPSDGSGGTCDDPGVNGDSDEAAIDAEWASAAAPSAHVILASCADTDFNFGAFIALENLLTSDAIPPAVMSLSYGGAEADNGSDGNAYINALYELADLEGVSMFVSTGDSGADANTSDRQNAIATSGISANALASTPYNVAVGGTDFEDTFFGQNSAYWNPTNTAALGSAKSYIPEIPWNDSCASTLIALYVTGSDLTYGSSGFCNSSFAAANGLLNIGAASGAPSSCAYGDPTISGVVSGTCAGYAKPEWQSIVGVPDDGVRDMPDVSLFAANGIWGHAYLFCYSDAGNGGAPCAQGVFNLAGGTSFAAPIMAAFQTLVNQSTGSRWGNPNPIYYALARDEYGPSGNSACNSSLGNGVDSNCTFYDVTQGDMNVYCAAGSVNCYAPSGPYGVLSTSTTSYSPAYAAGTGWDFATGIGTVNAYNLVTNWPSGVAALSAVINPGSTQ